MFHEIAELTRDGEGYVYYKGAHVEHYSFSAEERAAGREAEAARELAARCRHLEALGVPVTCGAAVWSWEWFEGLTPDTLNALPDLARELIVSHRDLYEDGAGRICWIDSRSPEPAEYPFARTLRARVFDRGELSRFELQSDDLGGHYHPLKAAGWNSAKMGQRDGNGCCYATTEQVLGWMRAKGVL